MRREDVRYVDFFLELSFRLAEFVTSHGAVDLTLGGFFQQGNATRSLKDNK